MSRARRRRGRDSDGRGPKCFRAHPSWRQLEDFVREYTAGLSTREIRRLFDRDAVQAYSVLTREHAQAPVPEQPVGRLLFRLRLAFLGLSYKLSPARRLLFAASLLLAVAGMLQPSIGLSGRGYNIRLDYSPFPFLASIGCLLFLLVLELVDRVRVRDELQVARELQADLLPRRLPELAEFEFAHSYRTANEVGGDYYDISSLPDGRLVLFMADASGHGMAAGLVMAIANAILRTALDLDPEPASVMALLNRTLYRTGTRRTFMTAFYGLLAPDTGRLEWACAAHPFPLLRRAGGEVEELGRGSLPLGIRQTLELECQSCTLAPGDTLLLFTDGLPEAVDARNESFGFPRIAELARPGGPAQAVHDRIVQAFMVHVRDEPLRDDMTLVILSRRAARLDAAVPA